MSIQPGDRFPDVELVAVNDGPMRKLSTSKIFAGKRVILIGMPGAFSPTCSDSHLPGFEVRAREIFSKGVDTIACVASNDPFVMKAWAEARGIEDEILMLADGNGDLARALGLEIDLSDLAMGNRAQRFAAIVEDGIVTSFHLEPDVRGVTVTSAPALLAELEEQSVPSP